MSDSLKYLKSFDQFIVYKLVASTSRLGKLDKIPVNRFNGKGPVSALDPANWGNYDEAVAATAKLGDGYGVGFVHSVESKLFTLDIDGAVMPDGQWHPLVGRLAAMLPGAAWERSVSGTGLHGWGRYEGPEPTHGCVAIVEGVKIELYTSNHFFALGDQETAMGCSHPGEDPQGPRLASLR
jgi:primase-polymerase (primpol)-like protein